MNWKDALDGLTKTENPGMRKDLVSFLHDEIRSGRIRDAAFPDRITDLYLDTKDVSLSTELKRLQNRYRSRQILGHDLLRLTSPPLGDADRRRLWEDVHSLKSTYEKVQDQTCDFEAVYEVREPIGEGGMSVVFRAVRKADDTEVAVKVLREEFFSKPSIVERFNRECRLSLSFDHPNVIRVHEAGEVDGRAFLVMEYLPLGGVDVRLGDPELTPPVALCIGRQAAEALAYLHSMYIVHRDVKLSNLLIAGWDPKRIDAGPPGVRVKLADFGLSKAIPGDGLTRVGTAMGTDEYAAPEQKRSARDVDHRADIYSLGVCLFRMLSGGGFPGNGSPALRELNPELPEELVFLVEKCIETDREKRFSSARELAGTLAEIERRMSKLK